MSQRVPSFFTQATASALPISSSTAAGKPGPARQTLSGLVAQQYYERTWDAPSPAALNAALNVLEEVTDARPAPSNAVEKAAT
jgi:hypothetical protein